MFAHKPHVLKRDRGWGHTTPTENSLHCKMNSLTLRHSAAIKLLGDWVSCHQSN